MQSISNSKRVPPLAHQGGRSYVANSDLQVTTYFSNDKVVVSFLEFFPNKILCLPVTNLWAMGKVHRSKP